ncbi:MAG: branched-chain amino acid ABC transporter permease [Armatimonadota bacterium]|nr:branched-chain amino acid ABC transporter permease [Armatimonadota bacterium]MDR7439507.1 branched-chain amino acid ABC transporter permease [Armatimonadota bacterium]MDR7563116.1 branched-chain amino acid ABC transporter permease [Armatimonadota bacterium]MDR7568417.1 branched-chain amino acid ABC transporter permease [Armatimonadota bacterium]MDR7600967.1 branched-chain amino acid ABC transporter permease [Armatimonadota bacterium]
MTGILLDGLVQGLQLALLSVGVVFVYGLGGVLNLAHGQVAVSGGLVAALLLQNRWPAVLACTVGILFAGFMALLLDQTLLRQAYARRGEERLLLGIILTLGLSFALDGLFTWRYPNLALTLQLGSPYVRIGGIVVRTGSLAVAGLAVAAFLVLLAFLKGTFLGKAIRCIIQNEVGAWLCGVDVHQVRTLTIVLSGLLAGVAAIAQGFFSYLGPEMGTEFTILALIVAVVGGVRSLTGTFLASLMLGMVNAALSYAVGTYATWIVLLAVAASTLLVRPEGLLAYWP